MAAASDVPEKLTIGLYADWRAAQDDWEALEQLVRDRRMVLDGMVLVRRGADAMIHVDHHVDTSGGAAAAEAVGGLLVGLLFPPALVAGHAPGTSDVRTAGGANQRIADEVDVLLPPRGSAIVTLFEELWADPIADALGKADRLLRYDLDRASADELKLAAAGSSATV